MPKMIHESVAGVLDDLKVKRTQKVNPANNRGFVNEGLDSLGIKAKKPVVEGKDGEGKPVTETVDPTERAKPDETDGEPDTSTTAGMGTSTAVNTDPANTETDVDVDAKRTTQKLKEGEEGAEGTQTPSKAETKAAIQASEAFFESLDYPVSMVIWEGENGEEIVEVHGLTNEDLAPFGGTCPAISPKYAKAAKSGGSKTDGAVGELMMYSRQGMEAKASKLLTGKALHACGWTTPGKGTGRGTKVIGGSSKGV